jgi:ribosomal protein S18 acetylase RimI-like enzyme
VTKEQASASIREVQSPADIDGVARLAREIWTKHYEPIIGTQQVEYMLRTFQSPDAVSRQITREGVRYFLVEVQDVSVGYLGFEIRNQVLFLSKIYIRDSARGNGYARASVEFVRRLAVDSRCRAIQLTVNRNNLAAIGAYERLGFLRTGEQVVDIGNGFVMDDYVYEFVV